MVAVKNEGKTAFVREVLSNSQQANTEAVNAAWERAGRAGSISESLVSKVRAEMKLTGNIKPGRKAADGNGAAWREARGPRKKAGGRDSEPLGTQKTAATARQDATPQASGDQRTPVLTKLEGEIEAMIFEVKGVGGLPAFEEAMRRARRILARSHQE